MLIQSGHQQYSFLCQRCGRAWTRGYEVRVASDLDGNEWRMYFSGGMATTAPTFGLICPTCGGLRVKVLPSRPEMNDEPADAPVRISRPHPTSAPPSVA